MLPSDNPLISAPRRRLVRFHRCIFHFRRCRFHYHWSGGRHFHAHLVGHQDLRRQRWKSRGNGGFHQQKIGFGLIRWRFSMIQPTFEISPTTFGFQPTKRLDLTDKTWGSEATVGHCNESLHWSNETWWGFILCPDHDTKTLQETLGWPWIFIWGPYEGSDTVILIGGVVTIKKNVV